jgi:hypothetical protein
LQSSGEFLILNTKNRSTLIKANKMNLPVAGDYVGDIPTEFDIDRIRSLFPGIESKVISMNNGAGSLVYGPAIES